VKKKLAVRYDEKTHEKYNKGFEVYKKLYPALKSVYSDQA
jgi:hypothetical protein